MYTANATINEIVQDALTTGYLTTLAENQLRQLLQTRYTHTDFRAFMALQYAALAGRVKQQSREPSPC
ncbi:MAG: hypothetical protein ACLFV6_17965 [Spirulinaceae cyanobacterium]